MRRLVTRKWLLTHALAVVLVVLFVFLGRWQLHRAQGGNTQSYAYALEWPTFALLVLGFWIKLIRDDLRPKDDGDEVPAPRRTTARSDARRSAQERDRVELAAYNRYVAERAREAHPSG